MKVFKLHEPGGFCVLSNRLSTLSENRPCLHIQVCENLIYPTGTGNDCQSIEGGSSFGLGKEIIVW
jgi:hypothetical protein